MKRFLLWLTLFLGLLFSSGNAFASSSVEHMSNIEVSEYAIRMSNVLENIQNNHLCRSDDVSCIRAEFKRNGISYDDKKAVQKRLLILIGSIH